MTAPKRSRIAWHHIGHDGLPFRRTLHTKYKSWKVELLLYGPNFVMSFGRQYAGWVTHRDLAEGHGRVGWKNRSEMDYAVDPHFGTATDHGAIEHGAAGRKECLIFNRTPGEVSPRPDQHIVAECERASFDPPQNGGVHDDTIRADADGATLGGQHRAEAYGTVWTDSHIAANNGSRRDPRSLMDPWLYAGMFDLHYHPVPTVLDHEPLLGTPERVFPNVPDQALSSPCCRTSKEAALSH